MNKIKISIFTLTLVILFSGCKKSFLDINTDPNRATESLITPDLTLAAQLNTVAARMQVHGICLIVGWATGVLQVLTQEPR
jgi:PBP1b-binding outer membrane lipoprotein LpoB